MNAASGGRLCAAGLLTVFALLASAAQAGELGGGWESRETGAGTLLFHGSFANDDIGWVCGIRVISKTSNGGRTWKPQFGGYEGRNYWFTGIAAVSPLVAVAVSHDYGHNAGGIVVRTGDGGKTWSPVAPGGETGAKYCSAAVSRDRSAVYLISNRQGLMVSRDAGLSWSAVGLPIAVSRAYVRTLSRISLPEDGSMIVAGDSGWLARSRDSGRTWEKFRIPEDAHNPHAQFVYLHFRTAEHGWAQPIDGPLLETRDGGKTWNAAPAPGRVFFQDAQNGWAFTGTTVWRTADAGKTWLDPAVIGGGWGIIENLAVTAKRVYAFGGIEGFGYGFMADRLQPGVKDEAPPKGVVPISFTLPKEGYATIQILDAQSNVVENVAAGQRFPAGKNTVWWDLATLDDFWPPFTKSRPFLYDPPASAQPMAVPGAYRWRGLWHPGLQLEYKFSYYPTVKDRMAWSTPDATGGWLGDHSPPQDVVRGGDAMWAGSFCEGGNGLIEIDQNMRKLWGANRIALACGRHLSIDGDSVYYIDQGGWAGPGPVMIQVHRTTKQSRRILAYSAPADKPFEVSGFEVIGSRAVIGNRAGDQVVVCDLTANLAGQNESLTVLRTVPLKKPGRIRRFDAKRLAVVADRQVVLLDPDTGETRPIVTGLTNPLGLAVDTNRDLYVGEMEPDHIVKIFSQDGTLLRTVGKIGRHVVGPFDPDNLESPSGLALDPQGRLWVAEYSAALKRISVWNRQGRCVDQVLGPADYGGGGGEIDPLDSNRLFFRGQELRRDPATGKIRLVNLLWRQDDPRYEHFAMPAGHTFNPCAPSYPFWHDSKLFFSLWNGRVGDVTTLWVYDRNQFRPVAAAGTLPARMYDALGLRKPDPRFGSRALQRVDARIDFNWPASPGAGVWSDRFAVRWTGRLDVPAAGAYTFYVLSDDGARLWLDGKPVTQDWTLHGPVWNQGALELTPGGHDLELEYFDEAGGARILLQWEGPGLARQTVPTERLRSGSQPDAAPGLAGVYYNPGQAAGELFAWTDCNRDGRPQAAEMRTSPLGTGGAIWGVRMNQDFKVSFSTVCGDVGVAFFDVEQLTPEGYPVYRLPTEYKMIPNFRTWDPNQVQAVYTDRKGNAIGIAPYLFSLAPDGRVNWRYKCRWPGLHAGVNTTATGAEPGLLIAPIRFLGSVTPSEAIGEVVCMGSNFGATDLFTADGLYVARAFQDSRRGLAWAFNAPPTPAELAQVSLGQEHFGGTFQETRDEKGRRSYRYVVSPYGCHCTVVELKGLDAVQRLAGGAFEVTARHWEQAVLLRQQRAAEIKEDKRYRVAWRSGITVDGNAGDWLGLERIEGFALAYDSTQLYVLCEAADPQAVFQNAAGKDNFLEAFKSGDVVDVMLQTRAGLPAERSQAGEGDLRLSFTSLGGQPAAILYDYVVPGTPESARLAFSSPWRSVYVDRALVLTSARVSVARAGDRFVLEAAIQLKDLHFDPKATPVVAGDVGRVLSDQTGTRTVDREYWSNKDTKVVADVPSEVMLKPNLWGEFEFEPAPQTVPFDPAPASTPVEIKPQVVELLAWTKRLTPKFGAVATTLYAKRHAQGWVVYVRVTDEFLAKDLETRKTYAWNAFKVWREKCVAAGRVSDPRLAALVLVDSASRIVGGYDPQSEPPRWLGP